MNAKAIALALLSFPSAALAQTPWVPPADGTQLGVEVLKPHFQSPGISAEVLFVSARVPLGPSLRLVSEVPLVHASVDFFGTSESQTAIGNPYLGLEWERAGFTLAFGARAPLADQDKDLALETGLFTDFDRWSAFLPDVIPVTAMAGYRMRARGFAFRAGLGPEALLNTGDGDSELMARYVMQAWYDGSVVATGVGFRGATFVTEDLGGVGQRTFDQVGAFLRLTFGQVRPALQVQVPLDNGLNDAVGIVYGLSVAVEIP